MKAIYKRQFRAYFDTMTGWIFMTMFLLAGGLIFASANILGGSAAMTTVLDNLRYTLLIISPLLTMGLLAGERKAKTEPMLLTAPVPIRSIVAGKFFSALTLFGIAIVISFIWPAILSALGAPHWGEVMTGYLGLLLFGGALTAVGMFVSSLTQNQVTAAAATLGVMLAILLAETTVPHIGSAFVRTALMKATLSYNFGFFREGIISLPAVVYFLGVIFFFLLLTSAMVERRRWAKRCAA